jgi:hypothetical protein
VRWSRVGLRAGNQSALTEQRRAGFSPFLSRQLPRLSPRQSLQQDHSSRPDQSYRIRVSSVEPSAAPLCWEEEVKEKRRRRRLLECNSLLISFVRPSESEKRLLDETPGIPDTPFSVTLPDFFLFAFPLFCRCWYPCLPSRGLWPLADFATLEECRGGSL